MRPIQRTRPETAKTVGAKRDPALLERGRRKLAELGDVSDWPLTAVVRRRLDYVEGYFSGEPLRQVARTLEIATVDPLRLWALKFDENGLSGLTEQARPTQRAQRAARRAAPRASPARPR